MHIIALILKIIGIVCLVILGLVLSLILLVLLVPLRYSVNLDKPQEEQIGVKFRLRWLLWLVFFQLDYKEELIYCLRIFGFKVLDSTREDDEQEEAPGEEIKEELKKDTKEQGREESKENKKEETDKESEEFFEQQEKTDFEEKVKEQIKEEDKEPCKKETEEGNKKTVDEDTGSKDEKQKKAHTKKENFYQRLKNKINARKEQAKDLVKKAKEIKNGWQQKLQEIGKKKDLLYVFFTSGDNKAGFVLILGSLKKMFRHLAPVKWKGEVLFGMENPAKTGQMLGILSVLYSFTGVFVPVTPDFEQKVFAGKYKAKGRVCLGYILVVFLSLWFNKQFKVLKTNYEKVRRRW